ncbi:MAG: ribosomal protein S18-alanine N-acetyltransferase [Acholeplasmataceae bacterium]
MIRNAKIDDILDIVNIEKKVFKESLGKQFLYQEINDNPLAKYFVYELGKQVIGYIGFRYDGETSEMMNFCIDPIYQNEGYGKALLTYGIDSLIQLGTQSISLEVRKSNIKAQAIYEKLGFKKTYTRQKYYKKEDAFVYIKEV